MPKDLRHPSSPIRHAAVIIFLFSSNYLFRADGGHQVLPDEFAADADATTAAAADHVNVKKKFLTDGEKKKISNHAIHHRVCVGMLLRDNQLNLNLIFFPKNVKNPTDHRSWVRQIASRTCFLWSH